MHSNVFPMKISSVPSLDSAFPVRQESGSFPVRKIGERRSDPIRSEIIARSHRYPVLSFERDSALYHAYAVERLGIRPSGISRLRTVDAVRHPDFQGVTERKRPFTIVLPAVPELPDFRVAEEAWASLESRFRAYGEDFSAGLSGFRLGISSRNMAYMPLVGAMALGMVSAFSLERVIGEGAQAEEAKIVYVDRGMSEAVYGEGLGEDPVFDTERLLAELASEDPDTKEFERRVRGMVAGYPIEDMVPEIVKRDRTVAMFLVAIAKKESDWGRRVPVLEGQDCYNYWGYRGIRNMMGTGGHTCFNSRADAVETVGNRLSTLINEYGLDTPEDLIVWKCGSTCGGHSSYSVQKWISDVELYYGKMND